MTPPPPFNIPFGCSFPWSLVVTQPGDFEGTTYCEDAVQEINKALPQDIRVFSCTKVGKGFRPREACNFREYEYILPVTMLRPLGPGAATATFNEEEAIATFFRIVRKFEGTHNFHNFTKIKTREVNKKLAGVESMKNRRFKHNKEPPGDLEEEDTKKHARDEEDGEQEEEEIGEEVEDEETKGENDAVPVSTMGTTVVDRIRYFNTDVGINPLFNLINSKSPDAKNSDAIPVSQSVDEQMQGGSSHAMPF